MAYNTIPISGGKKVELSYRKRNFFFFVRKATKKDMIGRMNTWASVFPLTGDYWGGSSKAEVTRDAIWFIKKEVDLGSI